jgi:leucine dehydrogenase
MVFQHPEFDHHEKLLFLNDAEAGFSAIIAVHDTTLGPAPGGCRMWPYASTNDAITDALRLSKAMTYKCSPPSLESTSREKESLTHQTR